MCFVSGNEEKQDCIKTLLNEQQSLCHQAAENCLSVQNLKRILYVYNRYFIALSRFKAEQVEENNKIVTESHTVVVDTKANVSLKFYFIFLHREMVHFFDNKRFFSQNKYYFRCW